MQRLNELAALPSFPLLDVYLRTFQPPGKRLQNEPRKWTVDEQGRMYATGKRKTAVARVWIKKGDGRFMVNEKVLSDYFPRLWHIHDIVRPFEVTHSYGKYDVWCTVQGGGKTGQAQAIRHGLSVALKRMEPSLKLALKSGTHKPRVAFAALLTHFFFSFSFFSLPRCAAHARRPHRREEKVWPQEGPQELHVGQALTRTTHIPMLLYKEIQDSKEKDRKMGMWPRSLRPFGHLPLMASRDTDGLHDEAPTEMRSVCHFDLPRRFPDLLRSHWLIRCWLLCRARCRLLPRQSIAAALSFRLSFAIDL